MSAVASLLALLEEHGVTHVVGIPDNTSAPLFDALGSSGNPRLVIVSREGEAFALASGLWLGGGSPLVVVQNTGLLEAGDALRGTAARMGVPLPVVVTARGYAKMESGRLGPADSPTRETLVRSDVDSVAPMTEPTLRAWGVPFTLCRSTSDVAGALRHTLSEAARTERPTALVLAAPLD